MTLVKMSECKISLIDTYKKNFPLLETKGISTCLAIIFQGIHQGIPYVGLYHWAGFETEEQSGDEILDNIFEMMASKITSEILMDDDDELPTISGLYIIGGERQLEEKQTILVSGTEKEVLLLQENAERLCKEYFKMEEEFDLLFCNYLTQDKTSIDITVFPDRLSYHYKNEKQIHSVEFGSSPLSKESKHGLSI